MFIGHYAPALAAATLPRAPRLWVLFVAAQAADIALALLSLAGVEHYAIRPGLTLVSPLDLYDVPWSHSLIGSLAVAALVALAVRLATRSKAAAWIAGGVAAVHWPLDWLVHLPDLTVAGSGVGHGLDLWDRPLIALPLELGLFAAGLVAYANATRTRDRRGDAFLALLAGAGATIQLFLWLRPPTLALDPAPANIAWSMLALYVMLGVFAWWAGAARMRR